MNNPLTYPDPYGLFAASTGGGDFSDLPDDYVQDHYYLNRVDNSIDEQPDTSGPGGDGSGCLRGTVYHQDSERGVGILPQTLHHYPCSVNNPLTHPDPYRLFLANISGSVGQTLSATTSPSGLRRAQVGPNLKPDT